MVIISVSQPTRWARTPRIKMTPLGGDEIIVKIYWKYNFRRFWHQKVQLSLQQSFLKALKYLISTETFVS